MENFSIYNEIENDEEINKLIESTVVEYDSITESYYAEYFY